MNTRMYKAPALYLTGRQGDGWLNHAVDGGEATVSVPDGGREHLQREVFDDADRCVIGAVRPGAGPLRIGRTVCAFRWAIGGIGAVLGEYHLPRPTFHRGVAEAGIRDLLQHEYLFSHWREWGLLQDCVDVSLRMTAV